MSSQQMRISTLWIVVMFNIVFADILSFIAPGFMAGVVMGTVDGIVLTQEMLLGFAILLEIPIAMIYFSRTLEGKANRLANLVAGIITIIFVVGGGSLTPHYIFFASIEVLCILLIIGIAFKRPAEIGVGADV